jgi:putative Se/S carrier protein
MPSDEAYRGESADRCVFLFEHFRDGMKAEDLLAGAGFHTHSGSPPPDVRTGCDLAISVPPDELERADAMLKSSGIGVMDIILKFKGELRQLQISSLVKKTDFGEYIMVRVGNMKLTFRKSDGVIVNISGGGCPDIPLLATELLGKRLEDATPPAQVGTTLCAYTLQKAYEYALRDWEVLH